MSRKNKDKSKKNKNSNDSIKGSEALNSLNKINTVEGSFNIILTDKNEIKNEE